MNEKLTSEQREWIHDEAWANFEYAEIDGQTRNVITLTQLFEILTAHTAEDVCPGCGYRYQYVDGTPAPCPQCITAEDEPKLKPGESIYQANRLSAEQEDK